MKRTRREAEKLFHLICVKDYESQEIDEGEHAQAGPDSARKFFGRYEVDVDLANKSVLDIGCGYGGAAIYMAQRGASRVVGIDIDGRRPDIAKSIVTLDYPHLMRIVEFKQPRELEDEKFDVVFSKDSFEHYADPESFIFTMMRHMREDGIMVVGFGPLWKSPYGGHIRYMTKLPWAHLLFPEKVILAERRRFRPEENATKFEEIVGGLNKMTFARYLSIVESAGLEIAYQRANASDRKLIWLCNILRRLPFLREYFTISVYSILRMKPLPEK